MNSGQMISSIFQLQFIHSQWKELYLHKIWIEDLGPTLHLLLMLTSQVALIFGGLVIIFYLLYVYTNTYIHCACPHGYALLNLLIL